MDMNQKVSFDFPEGFQQAMDCCVDFLPKEARQEFLIGLIISTLLM